jgi:hypothetical protein
MVSTVFDCLFVVENIYVKFLLNSMKNLIILKILPQTLLWKLVLSFIELPMTQKLFRKPLVILKIVANPKTSFCFL